MPIGPVRLTGGIPDSVSVTTATGTFGPVQLGVARTYASLAFKNTESTGGTMTGDLEGSLGGSGVWTSYVALTTANTTGSVHLGSTGLPFDRLRVNLSANLTTSAHTAYIVGAE